ncbi:MAG: hypothetical protein ABIH66_05490 [bacterium]
MSVLSNREKIIVATAVAVAMLAASCVFVAEPLLRSWKARELKITYLSQKVERMEDALKDEEVLMERHRRLLERAVSMSEMKNATRFLLERAGEAAEEAGISVRGVTPLPIQQYDFYSRVSARLDIECTLRDFVFLLYRIKNSDAALDVNRMEIGPRDRETDVLRGYIEVTTTILKQGGEENVKEAD